MVPVLRFISAAEEYRWKATCLDFYFALMAGEGPLATESVSDSRADEKSAHFLLRIDLVQPPLKR